MSPTTLLIVLLALSALGYYIEEGFKLALLGDVEEFWENRVEPVLDRPQDLIEEVPEHSRIGPRVMVIAPRVDRVDQIQRSDRRTIDRRTGCRREQIDAVAKRTADVRLS